MLRQESAECLVGKYINAYFVLDTFLVDLSKLVDRNQDGGLSSIANLIQMTERRTRCISS